jgi:hypothetical protein
MTEIKRSAAMHMAENEVTQSMDELRSQLGWLKGIISRLETDIKRGEKAIQRSYIRAHGSDVDSAANRVHAAVRSRDMVIWAEIEAWAEMDKDANVGS